MPEMLDQQLKLRVSEAIGRRDFLLAEKLCSEAEANDIAASEILLVRGALYSAQGDLERARSVLAQAYQAMPERGDIAYNYGVVLQQSGRISEAVEAWKKATSRRPQDPAAWLNLALGTLQLGDAQAALGVYRHALNHHSTDRNLLYNYANLLFRLGKLDKSERCYNKLLKIHSTDVQARINYGLLLKTAKRFSESESCYRQAIALGNPVTAPNAYFNLAHLLLQQGNWREGFAAYEWRLKLPGAIDVPWGLPEWKPMLPEGSRILLWNDQGQGDAIMFLRFAALLAQRGYRLFALAQNALKALSATAPGIEGSFCPLDEPQDMEAALPLCSLPHALGLESVDVWNGPYLSAGQKSIVPFAETTAKRIGIVWAGNPKHSNDVNRSMALADFAPLFGLPGLEWYSLQVGPRAAELAASPYRQRVADLAPSLVDFAATASVLEELDLLISVDSAPAHLAGAMGKPVWTLLPAVDTDWRWQTNGSTPFWYPSMRLFRQARAETWASVVATVTDAIRRPAAEARPAVRAAI